MVRGPFIRNWLTIQDNAERPFAELGNAVPKPDWDIRAAWAKTVAGPSGPKEAGGSGDFSVKARNLARGFDGAPEPHLVNALCIALLRRRNPPSHIASLFQTIWADSHKRLSQELPMRWVISSAQTLADFGATETQRKAGAELTVLCGMVKLYESERHCARRQDAALFRPARVDDSLVLDMHSFSLARGDLDRVLITRIWRAAKADPVAASLVARVIPSLLADDRGLFRRLRKLRVRRRTRRAGGH